MSVQSLPRLEPSPAADELDDLDGDDPVLTAQLYGVLLHDELDVPTILKSLHNALCAVRDEALADVDELAGDTSAAARAATRAGAFDTWRLQLQEPIDFASGIELPKEEP